MALHFGYFKCEYEICTLFYKIKPHKGIHSCFANASYINSDCVSLLTEHCDDDDDDNTIPLRRRKFLKHCCNQPPINTPTNRFDQLLGGAASLPVSPLWCLLCPSHIVFLVEVVLRNKQKGENLVVVWFPSNWFCHGVWI